MFMILSFSVGHIKLYISELYNKFIITKFNIPLSFINLINLKKCEGYIYFSELFTLIILSRVINLLE